MKATFIALPVLLLLTTAAIARDPIVGDWKWFSGSIVSFNQKGEAINSSGEIAKWERKLGRTGEYNYTVNWNDGRYIDTLTLSKDRKMLSGNNQHGGIVRADRWDKKIAKN